MKIKNILSLVLATTLVTSAALADPTNGTQSAYGVIASGEVDVFRTRCNGDEVTAFTVLGDGDGDIDCWLFDESGNEVGRDTDATDTCRILIAPRWNGLFRLEIRNNGRIPSEYYLRVF